MSFSPVPNDPSISSAVKKWLNEVYKTFSSSGSILWSLVDKAGSNITDIVTRNHNDLSNSQGGTSGQYYHLTSTQHTGLTSKLYYDSINEYFGFGTTSPATKVDINSDKVRVRTSKTPATASDTGNAGDICWDSNYIYVCISTNTWKRAAISTW